MNQPKTTFADWADRMILMIETARIPHQEWFSRVNAVLAPHNLENWRRQHGEDQVNLGIASLVNYVTSHWKPSWYGYAGDLLPRVLQETTTINGSEAPPKDGSDTSDGMNMSDGHVTAEVITGLGLHLDHPSEPSQHAPTPPTYTARGALSPTSESTENAHASRRRSGANSQATPLRADDLIHAQPSAMTNEVAGSDTATKTLGPLGPSTPSPESGKEPHRPSNSVTTTRSTPSRPRRKTRDQIAALKQGQAILRTRTAGRKPAAKVPLRQLPPRNVKNANKVQLRDRPVSNAKSATKVVQKRKVRDANLEGTSENMEGVSGQKKDATRRVKAQTTGATIDNVGPSGGATRAVEIEVADMPAGIEVVNAPAEPVPAVLASTSSLGLDISPLFETHALHNQALATALGRRQAVMKNLKIAEMHIEVLHAALENWTNLTEGDRQRLGRYHTREDVLSTLKCRQISLQTLKGEINCVEYEIETIQRQMGPTLELISKTKKAWGSLPQRAAGDAVSGGVALG